jgi:hypothetical protein
MSFDQKVQNQSIVGYLRMRSRSRSISFRQHPKHGHPKQNVIKLFYGFKLQIFNKAIVFDPDIPFLPSLVLKKARVFAPDMPFLPSSVLKKLECLPLTCLSCPVKY